MTESKYRGTQDYIRLLTDLVTAAQYRGTTTYQHIATIMGLPTSGNYMGRAVGQILNEISEDEVQRGRPMLSAVVINTDGRPGAGFYDAAVKFGRAPANADEAFWNQERAAVHDAWKRPLPQPAPSLRMPTR